VGPKAGVDAVVKRKIPSLCRDSNPPISIRWILKEQAVRMQNGYIWLRTEFSKRQQQVLK